MKIRPLNDRVLVKRLESEEKTAGGIIIPDSAKEKPAEGEVVAVGPGKLNEAGQRVALNVAVGDRVLFPSTAEPMSNWTARISSSCARMIFWALCRRKQEQKTT